MHPLPDSVLARQAEALLRATSEPALVNHCLRSYLWGVGLAALERVSYDAELLFVSAALHDLGLLDTYDHGGPFEEESGAAAVAFTTAHGWPERRGGLARQAIVLHVAADVTLDHGAEAYLLWHATGVDVSGQRLDDLPGPWISQTMARYPRLDFADHFTDLFAKQARRKPRTRAAELVAGGLLERLAACPLNSPEAPPS